MSDRQKITPIKTDTFQDYVILEIIDQLHFNRPSQKVLATRIKATNPTDALLQFKAIRNIDRLPYDTLIIPAEDMTQYPKGV